MAFPSEKLAPRSIVLIIATGVITLTLTGCGSDDEPTGVAQQTSTLPDSPPPDTPNTPSNPNTPCADRLGSSDAEIAAFRTAVCEIVNRERAASGAGPLTLEPLHTRAAQEHAADMSAQNYFSHTSLDGRSPFDRMRAIGIAFSAAGENIALGQRTPEDVMRSWMSSSGHRTNILNPGYTKIGVGYMNRYWVQTFTN